MDCSMLLHAIKQVECLLVLDYIYMTLSCKYIVAYIFHVTTHMRSCTYYIIYASK